MIVPAVTLGVLLVLWLVLFPRHVGDVGRVSLVDRLALAVRLAWARVELFVCPFRAADRSATDRLAKDRTTAELFMTADEAAVKFIKPGSVMYFGGFAATEPPAVWCHALNAFAHARRAGDPPLRLTCISQTSSSLRGVGSDSLDNFVADTPPGTVRRLIVGHLETCVRTLRSPRNGADTAATKDAARQQQTEIYNLPLGVISRLVGLQAAGEHSALKGPSSRLETTVGAGTYLDPTCDCGDQLVSGWPGAGHRLTRCCAESLVEPGSVAGTLAYSLPGITVALLHARCADSDGRVHFDENTVLLDAIAAARAARRNGGVVLVSVQEVVARDAKCTTHAATSTATTLLAHEVSAVVLSRSVLSRDISGLARHCRLVRAPSSSPSSRRHANNAGREGRAVITREEVCEMWERASLAYAFATTFHSRWRSTARDTPPVIHAHDEVVRQARRVERETGAPVVRVMIGVSLPELVAMRLAESECAVVADAVGHSARTASGASDSSNGPAAAPPPCIQLVVESGVVGGLPAPGFLFGNSFNPRAVYASPEFWTLVASRSFAHIAVLGAGEVDVRGHVNVSRSGPGLRDVIGCGGFPDICDGAAHAIIFVVSVQSSGSRYARAHKSSIVQRVLQSTFSPLAALQRRVAVKYCTELGVFHATLCAGGLGTRLVAPSGLELLVQERCRVQLLFDE